MDGVQEFICVCPVGITGKLCETGKVSISRQTGLKRHHIVSGGRFILLLHHMSLKVVNITVITLV